jgi:hypothetical protein
MRYSDFLGAFEGMLESSEKEVTQGKEKGAIPKPPIPTSSDEKS